MCLGTTPVEFQVAIKKYMKDNCALRGHLSYIEQMFKDRSLFIALVGGGGESEDFFFFWGGGGGNLIFSGT